MAKGLEQSERRKPLVVQIFADVPLRMVYIS